jgi:UDPglucose 6-dehydrogenase
MRIAIFGTGYVGLVTGTGISELGHDVLCVDTNADKVKQLNEGVLPIYEPGLADLVARNVREGRLAFSTSLDAPYDECDLYFIAVGTPRSSDGTPDLSCVFEVAKTLREAARQPAVVVVKSTVPVGTCAQVQSIVGSHEVASNPEFLKEGAAIQDFFRPDRVVIGSESERAQRLLRELYAPLQLSGERVIATDTRSSELIKYAANAMLAMRISFMNEISQLCEATGADIHAVRLGVGSDARIGKRFLYAGPGYGGSCFPKDVRALTALGRAHGVGMRLAEATDRANEDQVAFVARLVEKTAGNLEGKRVCLWGLAYTPDTDDVREAPSLWLTRYLISKGAEVVGHDPEARENFRRVMLANGHKVRTEADQYSAADGAHVLALLTEWRSYRAPNFARLAKRMAPGASVVDTRNVLRPRDVKAAGLGFQGLGVRRQET